jgi:hypothetical protein
MEVELHRITNKMVVGVLIHVPANLPEDSALDSHRVGSCAGRGSEGNNHCLVRVQVLTAACMKTALAGM